MITKRLSQTSTFQIEKTVEIISKNEAQENLSEADVSIEIV